jgi:signal transduction histidine kinase/CheY-like chemotaxis protein
VSDRLFEIEGQKLIQAIIRDIGDRKKAEADRLDFERQLQHSQRLESLGVLAGGIAHDFNNILTAVLGNADLVLHDMPLSAPGRSGIQEVVAASRRGAELCRQMLAYSGRGQFVIEEIDLRVLIEDMLNLVRSSIPKNVLLNLNLGRDLPHIRGDVSQINQIIMNLVINAAEAIGERSGVITISTGAQECTTEYFRKRHMPGNLPSGLYVSLEVSDTGIGMSRETMAQIFEPFFTTKFTGRGLGLSAILGIVRGHKGAIVVYSEPGRGSTFKVLCPAVEDRPAQAEQARALSQEWRGEGTVLLVDDEETIRTLGKMMLERLGFDVLVASDGREAVEIFAEHTNAIDLVVLDLTMPHMNGEEAFRAMREIRSDARVIMSSGYSETEIAGRFAGKGPVGFVQKPYTLATLRQKIEEALR